MPVNLCDCPVAEQLLKSPDLEDFISRLLFSRMRHFIPPRQHYMSSMNCKSTLSALQDHRQNNTKKIRNVNIFHKVTTGDLESLMSILLSVSGSGIM